MSSTPSRCFPIALSALFTVATVTSGQASSASESATPVVSCANERVGKRSSHALAYDGARRRVVMFGGISVDSTNRFPQSLFEWDGKRWNCIASGGPSGRADAFLEFDAGRRRLVLFGGRRSVTGGSTQLFTDTWEWDGQAWALKDTAGPGPRIHGAAAYDPTRKAVVIHGGGSEAGMMTDTWEWRGSHWRAVPLRLPFDGNGNSLIGTRNALVFFAAARDSTQCARLRRALLFEVRADSLVPLGTPGPCYSQQTPFTAARDGFLLYLGWNAGEQSIPESWVWRAGSWQRVDSSPTRRRGAAAAYDVHRQRAVLFGGTNESGRLGDTWEWDGNRWQEIRPRE